MKSVPPQSAETPRGQKRSAIAVGRFLFTQLGSHRLGLVPDRDGVARDGPASVRV